MIYPSLGVGKKIMKISSNTIWIGHDVYICGVTTFVTTFFFKLCNRNHILLRLSTTLFPSKDFNFTPPPTH